MAVPLLQLIILAAFTVMPAVSVDLAVLEEGLEEGHPSLLQKVHSIEEAVVAVAADGQAIHVEQHKEGEGEADVEEAQSESESEGQGEGEGEGEGDAEAESNAEALPGPTNGTVAAQDWQHECRTPDHWGGDCWQACHRRSGECAWCGHGMACCKHWAPYDPPVCQQVPLENYGTVSHHTCVNPRPQCWLNGIQHRRRYHDDRRRYVERRRYILRRRYVSRRRYLFGRRRWTDQQMLKGGNVEEQHRANAVALGAKPLLLGAADVGNARDADAGEARDKEQEGK